QFTEESISAIEPVSDHKVVKQYKLYSNYPNPFNPTTTLKFDVPQNTRNVELSIYNILGVKVKTLYSGSVNAGQYTSVWDGTNEAGEVMPSGVYFATLKTENFSQTIKMMLMK
ncbi:MAG TPA: T9SS type A sorting domain-containing protein, partial [Caldithrix abyssi]|nr:T9SS type A sorting domain-containing protein [Caldithrix abyssi]